MMRAFEITAGATALVVAGEAVALSIGILVVGRARDPWVTVPNVLYLAADILIGVMLLIRVFTGAADATWSLILLSVIGLTHGARDLELLVRAAHPFCFNVPLAIVNNVKLTGAIAAILLAAAA